MIKTAMRRTSTLDPSAAAREISQSLADDLGGTPDVVLVFSSSKYDYASLLKEINARLKSPIVTGCSSAGEFLDATLATGAVCVVAIRTDEMLFSLGIGRNVSENPAAAAREAASNFIADKPAVFPHRAAMILSDALAGFTEEFIAALNLVTGGAYEFFGGGAGDDAKFSQTHVFNQSEVVGNAVVVLEILSKKRLGIGANHGWEPTGDRYRVTEAQGGRLVSLNSAPAAEVFAAHAQRAGHTFNPSEPLPFFLHNILGIDTGAGYKLRVPLSVQPDGSVVCAAEIPEGSVVRFMSASTSCGPDGAAAAVLDAQSKIGSKKPQMALFFDCVATRLRMGDSFGIELQTVKDAISGAPMAGCNTYGQFARIEGQSSAFHNCTAVVCLFPE